MKLHHIGTELPPREDRDWVVSQELQTEAGITYRQLDYWCRTGLLTTLDGNTPGSGWTRRFHEDQVPRAVAIAGLLAAGIGLPTCRQVIDDLLANGHTAVGPITLTLTHPTGDTAA